eukprot:TRINITY_DN11032_c0_g1_i1.p1 TRINITY_DN11032_c0_g1~~TRINITY_DN11032_c0_g1_i1.p1  ORF type:complete len:1392 (+),score=339.87 TRINITY_DN11032_c0_g1_i1:522-4178(+)
MQVLAPCLRQMRHTTKQLSELLSRLLPQMLAGPLMEPRKEIQEAAALVLGEIGKMVRNAEVRELSEDVVKAVADPANQKYTQDVLAKLGSTTFMNYIDAASLALLIPIMNRGMKEREQKSRKWSSQILGAIVTLVKDIEYLRPYLPNLLPLLKECAVDPAYEIQREAAKACGMLTQELPDWSRSYLQIWLSDGIRSGDDGMALGCAHALSEVLLRMPRASRESYVDAIVHGARSKDPKVRAGYMYLLDFLPQALKNEFVPYVTKAFPAILAGMVPEKEDPGFRAAQALVGRFGASAPQLLLPGLENAFFQALTHTEFVFPTAVKHAGFYEPKIAHPMMREIYLKLLAQLCDKILEHKRFGQDMLTCDDCSSRPVREQIMVLLEVIKEDPNAQVQRQAKQIWRNCGGQAKTTKEVMPALEAKLLSLRSDPIDAQKRRTAELLLGNFAKAGELGGEDGEGYLAGLPDVPALQPVSEVSDDILKEDRLAKLLSSRSSAEATDAQPEVKGEEVRENVQEDREGPARSAFKSVFPEGSWDAAGPGAEAARAFCETMAASVAIESISARGLFGEAKPKIQMVSSHYAGDAVSDEDLLKAARGIATAVFGQGSLTAADELDEIATGPGDTLLRVDDLMLMYGGGHLLLKDTLLELKKNHRYGVVGHNGCGKTTLMRELQAGRVAGMPDNIRCVHVSDADLGNMKVMEMTSIDFVRRDIVEGSGTSAEQALLEVGFPTEMQEKPVADLSGGWRMRLLLAGAMLKQADILLLDEPTNHLDVHAIEWLCQYLLSLKTGALMVISHDPHFLNAVCTDIIQYKEKKLVYYEGNFDSFKESSAITDDDAEALLAGAAKAPAPVSKSADGQSNEATADTSAVDAAAVLDEPKAQAVKLVFPIPGKLEGIRTNSKPVMEIRNVYFEYPGGKGHVIKGVSAKLNLGSRVALVGNNGAGKSTLLNLMCGELIPTEHEGKVGEVWQHHNLRLAYIAQHHMTSLGKWYESSPFTYLSYRFQNGWDEEAQRHLMDPRDEDHAAERKELATKYGKYGKGVQAVVSRSKQSGKLVYEVQWEGMDDQKQNTFETLEKLRALGCEGYATACDLRLAAQSAGLDVRPISRREIVKHLEQFGIDEEMCCNRHIGGFSAGQKSKLALSCAVWTKPHLLALDEPTNYLDVETVESLARALKNFRGGVVVVTHSKDFIDKVCTEEWLVKDGSVEFGKVIVGGGVKNA